MNRPNDLTIIGNESEMAKIKNWEIKKLSKKDDLTSSSIIILKQRFNQLLNSIEIYFLKSNEENLHKVRIALRRVRYSMELFAKCFNRKKYLVLYKTITELQDLSGAVRDLDIFGKNLVEFGYTKSSEQTSLRVIEKKNKLEANYKLELSKFLHSKSLKDFKKLID